MSMYPQSDVRRIDYAHDKTAENVKLNFFHMVYLWMAIGLMLTAVVSYAVAHFAPQLMPITRGAGILIVLGLFALAWFTQTMMLRLPVMALMALFSLYAGIMGLLISPIWVVFEMGVIGLAFGLTGGIFLIMSIFGLVTKMDLTKLGAIAGMCALGLFGVSIANAFMGSSALSWGITYGVVLIFPILLAYKTQELSAFADQAGHDPILAPRMAIIGSLILYISFINIFMSILRILGSRK